MTSVEVSQEHRNTVRIAKETYLCGEHPQVTDRVGLHLPYACESSVDELDFSCERTALLSESCVDLFEGDELISGFVAEKVYGDRSLFGWGRRASGIRCHVV